MQRRASRLPHGLIRIDSRQLQRLLAVKKVKATLQCAAAAVVEVAAAVP